MPISDNMGNLVEDLTSYQTHLQQLYEMEMYYGEPSIKELILHSREVIDHVKGFSDVYNIMSERSDEVEETKLD